MSSVVKKLIRTSEDWFGGSDFYRLIYTFYVVSTIWMLKAERLKKNKLIYASYRILQFSSVFIYPVCVASFIYDAYLIRESIEKLAYNLGLTVFFLDALIRLFFLYLKKDEYEDMLDVLNMNFYLEDIGTSPRDLRILKHGERTLVQIAKSFYFMQVWGIGTRALCHLISDKSLPMPLPYVDKIESPSYEILFVLIVLAYTYFVALVISQILTTYGILIRISRHFVILSENISDIGRSVHRLEGDGRKNHRGVEGRREQEEIFVLLKKSAIHHREILKIIKRLGLLLREGFMVEIFGGGMLLVDLFFHATLNLQKDAALWIACQAIFSFSALLAISITCYFGSQIQTRSVEAENALYSVDWLDMDLRNKQVITFMQMAFGKPPVIKAGIFALDLNMYLKFLNSIYSFLAFIQSTL